MSSLVLSLVAAIAQSWTAIYTAGLPRAFRQIRRNEIASDLWECYAEVARGEQSVRHASAEIIVRLFLGMPDDILWRWETQMNSTTTHGEVPLWINATGLGLPLSAVAIYFAAAFANTLNNSTLAIAIRESLYIFPAILTFHVAAICTFIGFSAMVDLRLLGWTLKRTPVLEVSESLLPWAMGGFGVVLVSGAFAYISNPVRFTHNIFFNLKIALLALGGLNAWATHRRVFRYSKAWAEAGLVPGRDKIAAAFSLVLWGLLIVSGQLIAFVA